MKNFSFLVIFSTIFYFNVFSQSGAITNIVVSQRADGSGLIDVHYNLSGSGTTYYISLEASFDNGVTFTPVASSFLSGNIGAVSPGTNKHIIWNGKGSNNNTYSTQAKVKLIANTTIPCGQSLTVNHIAGEVAPVTKTTTYGTVTGIPGEPTKCWITSNLGSDHQASQAGDTTEASAGWYWQFNRKQGYKHNSSTLTPSWTITSINENCDWISINDPCNIELGYQWRLPTYSEWFYVNYFGGWTNFFGPWESNLKLHLTGYLHNSNGLLMDRGYIGLYWSSSQADVAIGWNLLFFPGNSAMYSWWAKSYGCSIRCLRDYCSLPLPPTMGSNIPSQNSIIWSWNTSAGATGYKWNTTNDYATATELGIATTKTETGLVCNTPYTRYAWTYNSCGFSSPVTLTQSTNACSSGFTCGQSLTINHVAGEVAPVSKTTTYGTVTGIPGEPSKCWITSNLGSDHQANSVDDATEASAGWYWQFNLKQGYKHDGSILIPAWTITYISENSDWQNTNDPCNLELGPQWRLPTFSEWYNVDYTGGWNHWSGPWGSGLKLHAAGVLSYNNGSLLIRGNSGYYWSSKQDNMDGGFDLYFTGSNSSVAGSYKALGVSSRCISDN